MDRDLDSNCGDVESGNPTRKDAIVSGPPEDERKQHHDNEARHADLTDMSPSNTVGSPTQSEKRGQKKVFKLSAARLKEYKKAFEAFDTDNSGKLRSRPMLYPGHYSPSLSTLRWTSHRTYLYV